MTSTDGMTGATPIDIATLIVMMVVILAFASSSQFGYGGHGCNLHKSRPGSASAAITINIMAFLGPLVDVVPSLSRPALTMVIIYASAFLGFRTFLINVSDKAGVVMFQVYYRLPSVLTQCILALPVRAAPRGRTGVGGGGFGSGQ